MITSEELEFVGLLGTDTGRVAIVDPCYAAQVADAEAREPGSAEYIDFEYATVTPTPPGDGIYDVFNVRDERGRVVGIYVDLAGQFADADTDESPAPAKVAA
ncbi:hypothetical protein [Streptomyces sp. OR43]|uniref:hypothetical protein n=1 Tax=Streptomyces sp. or43 TaxID=2478957 RepID=UPI0011CE0685|nr:hypothetical protein [Streptomyces sp. or43]TXS47641.1 hypothetical protein EAO72_07610 [Streptomyces sp. or43]